MPWDGTERRRDGITLAEVENAVYKANEKFFEKIQKMCDDNLEKNFLKHVQEFTHFDKDTKSKIYEVLSNFKNKTKLKFTVGIPLFLLITERILTKIGLF